MVARNIFDPVFYLNKYLDVAASGIDPYTHYTNFGWKENRDPNVFFSSEFYKTINTDVNDANKNPLDHYVEFGVHELRDPSPFFDTSLYLLENTDVANGRNNPLEHFIKFGNQESRKATELFDSTFYTASNLDVGLLIADNLTTAITHFAEFGHKEGRDPSPTFNTKLYLEDNIDVAASDYTAFEHYLYAGKTEGRRADEVYTIPLGKTEVITGVSLAETITGNSENNSISGAGGDDILSGAAGADTISSGTGNDNIDGGAGDDLLTANSGDNSLIGGPGDDIINAGSGRDLITGGSGNDVINLLTTAQTKTDVLIFSGLTNTLNGSDTIITFQADDVFDFSNILNSGSISNTSGSTIAIASTTALSTESTSIPVGDETVYIAEVSTKTSITTEALIVAALTDGGDLDAIDFAAQSDALLIIGGSDDDTTHFIYGIDNDETPALVATEIALLGTITTDISNGVRGLSTTNISFVPSGNNANNNITGSNGIDVINGLGGNDFLVGGPGNDTISAGTGSDSVTGGSGDDTINFLNTASSGVDTIIFSGLTDSLNGSDTVSIFQAEDKYNFSNVISSGTISNIDNAEINIVKTEDLSGTNTILIGDKTLYIAKVSSESNINTQPNIIAALTDDGVLDALQFIANADAILMVGGADNDSNHYIYGINNDSTATITLSEIALLATVTTDISNGISGLTTDNFIF